MIADDCTTIAPDYANIVFFHRGDIIFKGIGLYLREEALESIKHIQFLSCPSPKLVKPPGSL